MHVIAVDENISTNALRKVDFFYPFIKHVKDIMVSGFIIKCVTVKAVEDIMTFLFSGYKTS